MTEEFKKGLATGIAIGGVTIKKIYGGNVLNGVYVDRNTLIGVGTVEAKVLTGQSVTRTVNIGTVEIMK